MSSAFRAIEASRASLGVGSCGAVFACRTDVTHRVEGGVCVVAWVTRNSRGGSLWAVVTYGTHVTCHSIIRGGCGCIAGTVVLS